MPMNLNATQTDLFLKKLYDETGVTENQAFEEALAGNFCLQEEYHTYEDVKDALNQVIFSPSASVVKAIMDYSANTALHLSC